MARKKKHGEPENHERWLVSYADFITLLFAFFVVMFASSQRDKDKAKQFSQAVQEAIDSGGFRPIAALLTGKAEASGKPAISGDAVGEAQRAGAAAAPELAPSFDLLNRELESEVAAGKIRLSLERRGLVISLREAAFFPSGDDTIYDSTLPSMEKIARMLKTLPNHVRLEGHTDSIPIHNARFRSNWDLSAARAIAVMEFFHERCDVPTTRFAVAGYAENLPLESNDTEEGRARNRRVDVVVLNTQVAPDEGAINNARQQSTPPAQKHAGIGAGGSAMQPTEGSHTDEPAAKAMRVTHTKRPHHGA